ncbi:phosphate ABC transporter permease [Paraglaciecola hydrolytica]|uniref:Phosphate ABC transporter permease n=2 Tax=Paraglaciecola hydrolytica TaxID=1799789 RepID=A0A136A2Q2_9ALTE|nr:phosphate ABC transporter permease [Paraglaciecola hydrolytica]
MMNNSIAAEAKPQILMAGDSTMSIKALSDYPETGWGMPFATFFAEGITIHNLAKNGRSTASFRSEGLWQQLMEHCQAGDYVFIQFGHNDEVSTKATYTTPEQFKANLLAYINEVKAKQAQPILLSPMTRRYFAADGKIEATHPYSAIVRDVAKQSGVTFIDMDSITRDYFTALGDVDSALRFMHIKPDLHPNYPHGVKDNTHFNELGAREVAQLVLTELKLRQHSLVNELRPTDPKHLKLSY